MTNISSENRQAKYHSPIPKVNWGTEHMSDNEQDMIRYLGFIVEDGKKILSRAKNDKPVFRADVKEWKSYIRALRLILNDIQEEVS